jgi:hypothetical protein
MQILAISLTTALANTYQAHLEQWLAGGLRFKWICMMESMQIPVILLTAVMGKSYLAHLEQWPAGWLRFQWICMMESMQIPGILYTDYCAWKVISGTLGTVASRMAKISVDLHDGIRVVPLACVVIARARAGTTAVAKPMTS